MKKFLALFLALSMLLAAVPALAESTGEIDWFSKEKYTFNWTQYYVTPAAEDAVTIKLLEDKFNVDINILPIEDSSFLEVLNTYIMGGDTPDVIRLKDPSLFGTYVDQGVLGAMDMEIVKEYAPIIYGAISDWEGGLYWSFGNVDGVQYGIPSVSTGNLYHLPIVYNETWMKNVGVETTPETLDELYDLMVKFTKEDPDQDGLDDTYGLASDGMRLVFGAYGVNPGAADGRTDHSYFQLLDGEVEYAASTQRYKEALKVLNQWYEEGLIDPEFVTGENTGGYWAISHSMVNQRIGMTVRGNYYHWNETGDYSYNNEEGVLTPVEAGSVAAEFTAANPEQTLIYGGTVTGPNGEQGVKSWNSLAQIYCFSPAVTEDPEKFARIMAIMNFMARGSSYNDMETRIAYYEDVYGEEGKYWYFIDKENGEFGTTTGFRDDYPEFDPIDRFGRTEYGPSAPGKGSSAGGRFAESLGYHENGIVNLVQYSLPKMNEYQTNLTNIKDKWMIAFVTGEKDVEADWDEYMAEMNNSGLQEMVDEVREYYWSSHTKE